MINIRNKLYININIQMINIMDKLYININIQMINIRYKLYINIKILNNNLIFIYLYKLYIIFIINNFMK